MEIEAVTELALKSGLFTDPKVEFLAEGFGNINYLIQEDGSKYVLRLKKATEEQFLDSLEREFVFYKFFEANGIDFCPKALYYDHADNFLIESFIEGTPIAQKDFTDAQIDEFASNLFKLFNLDADQFFSFCKESGYKIFEYVDPIDSLQQYGFKRFKEAKNGDIDTEILDWVEERLNENLTFLKSFDDKNRKLGFSWGDIQSELFIDESGKLFFCDFEHVTVSNSFGLSYIKTHGSFSAGQLDYLIERCAFYFDRNKGDLVEDMNANERIVKTNDVVWAAMMYASSGEQKFKDLMHERIEIVKKLLV